MDINADVGSHATGTLRYIKLKKKQNHIQPAVIGKGKPRQWVWREVNPDLLYNINQIEPNIW